MRVKCLDGVDYWLRCRWSSFLQLLSPPIYVDATLLRGEFSAHAKLAHAVDANYGDPSLAECEANAINSSPPVAARAV